MTHRLVDLAIVWLRLSHKVDFYVSIALDTGEQGNWNRSIPVLVVVVVSMAL